MKGEREKRGYEIREKGRVSLSHLFTKDRVRSRGA